MSTEAETENQCLVARVPFALRRSLIDLAKEHDRSLSAEVRVALRSHVEQLEQRNLQETR